MVAVSNAVLVGVRTNWVKPKFVSQSVYILRSLFLALVPPPVDIHVPCDVYLSIPNCRQN